MFTHAALCPIFLLTVTLWLLLSSISLLLLFLLLFFPMFGTTNLVYYSFVLIIYIGGQKQASRVNKMIQLCTHKVKKLLEQYKTLQVENRDNVQLSIVEVLNLESPFWRTEQSYMLATPGDRLPAGSQRRLLELKCLKDRAQEEKQLCIGDLVRITVFYQEHINQLNFKVLQSLQNIMMTNSSTNSQMTSLPPLRTLYVLCLFQLLEKLLHCYILATFRFLN